ncbi:MAG: galactokinase, partial [Scrofimicrobium sp.]
AKHEPVPMPAGWTFAVAVSGVLAEKTGAALESYNNVSLRVAELVDAWNLRYGTDCLTFAEVLNQSEAAAEELGQLLVDDPELAKRPDLMERLLAYLVEVGEVIPTAEAALKVGDVEAFGSIVDLSHRNADENLHNQIEETNALQRIARELGAGAASAFGAGFGGSVWALIPEEGAQEWADAWLETYLEQFPENRAGASVLITKAGSPAQRI